MGNRNVRMNVIVSSFGDLFFDRTVKALSKIADVSFIQGAVPTNKLAKFWVKFSDITNLQIFKQITQRYKSSEYAQLKCCSFCEYAYMLSRFPFPHNDILYAAFSRLYGFWSKRYIENASVFHVRSGSGQGGAIKKAKEKGMIVIVDHSIASIQYMEEILSPEYKKYGKKYPLNKHSKFRKVMEADCCSADYILVNSDFVKSTLIKDGYSPDKIKVIYLGVREDFIGLKTDYCIPKDEPIKMLFVGGFNFRKGAEYVLKAIDILYERNIPFRLQILGNISEFKGEIEKHHPEKIDILGTVMYDQLKDYYASADMFLFPSLSEGSTRAGMEAMGIGLPVLVTENCGIPAINDVNAIVVPIKDANAIADGVVRLYQSKELRERLGKEACELIKKCYNSRSYQENLLDFYTEITT